MKKSEKGSIGITVLITVLFFSGLLMLLYSSNANKIQTITEKIDFIKSIYEKNVDNVDEVYEREFSKKDTAEPIIKTLPSEIITNITLVDNSYVTFGYTGGKKENYKIVVIDKNFTSFTELVSYADNLLNENKQYEVEMEIKITAIGNNGKKAEIVQNVKFIRGVKVTNESELNDALASTSPSYISIANNIECTNSISIDGVTHKIDLNNNTISKTVTNESFTFINLGSNTNITIIDSSTEKKGTIVARLSEETPSDGKNRESNIIGINNKGILNIESVKIGSEISRKITSAKKGVGVHDTGIAIQNSGTINLNEGTVSSSVITQACVYLAVQISEATAKGIVNSGTINATSGDITASAEALVIRASGATVYGRKWAYAYGIENSGTINNSENINFSISAIAVNDSTVYEVDTDSANIK